jgi:hypothetical protein
MYFFYTNNIYNTTKEKRSNNAIVLTLSEKGQTESERVVIAFLWNCLKQ